MNYEWVHEVKRKLWAGELIMTPWSEEIFTKSELSFIYSKDKKFINCDHDITCERCCDGDGCDCGGLLINQCVHCQLDQQAQEELEYVQRMEADCE